MDTTALAEKQTIDVAAWVSGQPGFTTTEVPLILAIVRAAFARLRAVAGEPAGYADGSRLHELREGRLNLALWAEKSAYADTPPYTHPQPATPASGWRPIAEASRGEYDTIIMGFVPDEEGYAPSPREGFWSHSTKGWRLTSDPEWKSNPQPTHWMPLPATPNPEQPGADR